MGDLQTEQSLQISLKFLLLFLRKGGNGQIEIDGIFKTLKICVVAGRMGIIK